jgi:hypothetical protein
MSSNIPSGSLRERTNVVAMAKYIPRVVPRFDLLQPNHEFSRALRGANHARPQSGRCPISGVPGSFAARGGFKAPLLGLSGVVPNPSAAVRTRSVHSEAGTKLAAGSVEKYCHVGGDNPR